VAAGSYTLGNFTVDAQGRLTAAANGTAVTSFNSRTGAVVPTTGDYTVAQITGAAPLASPALTGTPTAPTAALGTATTQLASTAFVANFSHLLNSDATVFTANAATTAAQNLNSYTIAAGLENTAAKKFRFSTWGTLTTATSGVTSAINWIIGGVSAGETNPYSSGTTSANWRADADCITSSTGATGTLRCLLTTEYGIGSTGPNVRETIYSTITVDFTGTLAIQPQVIFNSSSTSNNMTQYEVSVMQLN